MLFRSVNAFPESSFTGDLEVCQNAVGTYTASAVGPYAYSWTVAGGTLLSGDGTHAVTVQWTDVSGGTISLNVTSDTGCTSLFTTTEHIVVNALPVPTVNGPSTVWDNSTVTYTTESGMTDYLWEVTGGTIQSGENSDAVTVVWGTGPVGSVKVSYASSKGCEGVSDDFNVTIQAAGFIISTGTDIVEGEAPVSVEICLAPDTYAPSGGIEISLSRVAITSSADDADYTLSGGVSNDIFPATIAIPEGERCVSFSIGAILDDWIEGPESLVVNVSAADFPDSEVNFTIVDRTNGEIVVKNIDNDISEESTGKVAFWIGFKENVKSTKAVKVWYLLNGIAEEGVDYEDLPGYVIIPAGDRGAEVEVTPKGNFIVQGDRTLELVLDRVEVL